MSVIPPMTCPLCGNIELWQQDWGYMCGDSACEGAMTLAEALDRAYLKGLEDAMAFIDDPFETDFGTTYTRSELVPKLAAHLKDVRKGITT